MAKMAKNDPPRNEYGNLLLNQDRKCLVCGEVFNCGSIGKKVYCSTRCRMVDYRKRLNFVKGVDNDRKTW